MARKRVVIVGGGGAGDSAAFGLRSEGFDGDITILSADSDRPYDRPYLSKEFLRGEVDVPKVYLHEPDAYLQNRIDLRQGEVVTGGSLAESRLTLATGEIGYDTLILATGGTPRRLPAVPHSDNVFTLRSLTDARALREALHGSSRVLLIGAGFIGAEVGASARALGKDVLLLEAAPVPLARALGEAVGNIYGDIHRAHGVSVKTATTVTQWHENGPRVNGVTLSDGSREEVDVVLLGTGIDPNLDVATALGLRTDAGGVVVEEGLRATENVYAAGDIANHRHPILGRQLRVEHWEVAKGQGAGVARSVVRGQTPYETIPYFWSDQYEVSLEYRGNASGDHQAVWRGDREALRFSVFYLREGRVEAVLSMNDGDTNAAAEALIKTRVPVDVGTLSDPATDVAALASPAGVK
ncbi:MAG: FAD-dependent oxidoreductase [Candidatus Dormibacteraeota bacterium]|nr:FAD-dependent oxidoreductase [Candidatus Dormibacteraeota bacterium]